MPKEERQKVSVSSGSWKRNKKLECVRVSLPVVAVLLLLAEISINMFVFGLLMTKIGGDKRSHESLSAPWLHSFSFL